MRALILTVALMLPSFTQAEPQPAVLELMPFMEEVPICFDSAFTPDEARICSGIGTKICMESSDNGYTTLGMMFCAQAETQAWDDLLNREYQSRLAGFRRVDAQEAEHFPQFANRAESLRNMQRAWITFRDAKCSLSYDMWGAGSMRNIAGSQCRQMMTAEQTIYLRFLGSEMR